jgi:CheY-like chemotaxis protein
MNKQNIKVLIVEDEKPVAETIRIQLEQLGYAVVGITDNAEQAISLVAQLQPDLVLMDIVLKGDIDGIQAAEAIRSQYQIPVIYLTAYTNQDFLDRAKLTEPLAYIVKPCSQRDLYAALTVALYKAESPAPTA